MTVIQAQESSALVLKCYTFCAMRTALVAVVTNYLCRLFSPENLPNIALVIVAGVTGWFIAQQAKETARSTRAMQDSVDATKKKERAKLTVDIDSRGVDFSKVQGHSAFGEAYVEVTHYGPTHAFNVRAIAGVVLSPSTDPPPMSEAGGAYIPTVIKSDSKKFLLQAGFIRQQSDLDQIQDQKLFLHFFGMITYEDVFDERHETTFRYLWKIDGHPNFGHVEQWEDTSRWELHGPKEDNRAT
ncbi:MAG: hypothetical protein WBZ14_09735 [Terriglobales bacterium]|jgi:hypothetical protein